MITVNHLSKVYKSGKGIFDLTFSIEKGEVFGYLGPNGAGKTTTIRHLLGFIHADKGTCSINGLDCRANAAEIQKSLGYLPGEIAFFDDMTGMQFLNFMSDMRGIKDRSRCTQLIERFELDTTRKIRKMSKGMKQKVGLITAFMHDPSVYILDEPTSGLDPLMQSTFIELILEEKGRGKTIMMSSHSFEEIDRTCDRAGIIRDGKLVTVEDIKSLKAAQRKAFGVTVASPTDVEMIMSSGLEAKLTSKCHLEVIISGNYDLFFNTLAKCKVQGLDVSIQSLEQVFMKYYGQEVR